MRAASGRRGRRYSGRQWNGSRPGGSGLLDALRSGDERAFARIVDELSPGMLRMARLYVSTDAAAEEVVQETWLGVVKGLDGFEGRSSLKTWVFRILINMAKTRGVRDSAACPSPRLSTAPASATRGVLDPERFFGERPRSLARPLGGGPDALAGRGGRDRRVDRADSRNGRAGLPGSQREVITLRDIVGCSAERDLHRAGPDRGQPARAAPPCSLAGPCSARERVRDATEPTL